MMKPFREYKKKNEEEENPAATETDHLPSSPSAEHRLFSGCSRAGGGSHGNCCEADVSDKRTRAHTPLHTHLCARAHTRSHFPAFLNFCGTICILLERRRPQGPLAGGLRSHSVTMRTTSTTTTTTPEEPDPCRKVGQRGGGGARARDARRVKMSLLE